MIRIRSSWSRWGGVAAVSVSATAAVLVAAAGSAVPVSAAASTVITITTGACSGGGSTYCFSPESATVPAGTPVTWTNMSGVAHTATVCTSSACPGAPASTGTDMFNVSIAAPNNSTGSFTFASPGTYYYYCTIHGYTAMHGTITVTSAASAPASAGASPTSAAAGSTTTTPATGAAPPITGLLIAAGGVLALLLALSLRLRRR